MPDSGGTCVVYWMQKAQRATDNPALDVAVKVADELKIPVVVFLPPYRSTLVQISATTAFWSRAFRTLLKSWCHGTLVLSCDPTLTTTC